MEIEEANVGDINDDDDDSDEEAVDEIYDEDDDEEPGDKLVIQLLDTVGFLYKVAKPYHMTPRAIIPQRDFKLVTNIKIQEEQINECVIHDRAFARQLVEDNFLKNVLLELHDEEHKDVYDGKSDMILPEFTESAILTIARAFDNRYTHLIYILGVLFDSFDYIDIHEDRRLVSDHFLAKIDELIEIIPKRKPFKYIIKLVLHIKSRWEKKLNERSS